jgi:hypothetical protein
MDEEEEIRRGEISSFCFSFSLYLSGQCQVLASKLRHPGTQQTEVHVRMNKRRYILKLSSPLMFMYC